VDFYLGEIMKISLSMLIMTFVCSAYAVDCVKHYDKDGCNGVAYSLGSSMELKQYDVIYDSDKDGVPDKIDKCPNTPLNAIVDSNGCEIKTAPITPKKVEPIVVDKPVEENTPPVANVQQVAFVTLKVNFDSDKYNIKPQYNDEMSKMAQFLVANPAYYAKIVAHTDSTSTSEHNKALSFNRANSVKNMLVSLGVDAMHLSVDGMGETQPIATNSTQEGRAKNRRIEVSITKKGE
jgi:OOP family OmpA-OmpF porin